MSEMIVDADKRTPTKTFQDATPYLKDPKRLMEKAKSEGYLFFKDFFPRETVLELRQQFLEIIERKGYLDTTFPLIDGVANLEAIHKISSSDLNWNGVGVPIDVYLEVQKLESFHALAHEPKLLQFYSKLFGEQAFPHPRHIARILMPHRDQKATPSHQDYLYIQGAEQTWTCWMPLGDAPRELGNLMILEGSNRAGLLEVMTADGAGGFESILCGLGCEWVTGDYEAGDLVTFNSLTVHKSLPNNRPNQIRISVDMRFQPLSAPISELSLLPHGPFEWSEIYKDWTRTDLQYYWENIQFSTTVFDKSVLRLKEKIC